MSKKAVRVPLTEKESKEVDVICRENGMRRATVLQCLFLKSLAAFEKMVTEEKKAEIDMEKHIDVFADEIFIQIEDDMYLKVTDYSKRMMMSNPMFIRYLILPEIWNRRETVL